MLYKLFMRLVDLFMSGIIRSTRRLEPYLYFVRLGRTLTMIQPRYIKYESCPDCGTPWHSLSRRVTTIDRTISFHTNGENWESVTFACGRQDEFSPNFSSIQTESPCQNTPEMRIRKQKREKAGKELAIFLGAIDVDEDFRQRLMRDYRYLID